MTELAELSLDDIIAMKRRNGFGRQGFFRGNRNRRGNGQRAPMIRNRYRQPRRTYDDEIELSENVYTVNISNLGPLVTTQDLQELFEGHPFVDVSLQYDDSGKSYGTAVVLFERFADGMNLKRQFAGIKLDGRIMEMYVSGPGDRSRRRFRNFVPNSGRVTKVYRNGNRPRIAGMRGRRRKYNFNNNTEDNFSKNNVTKEQLDRELDAYMRGSKHTKIVAP